MEFLTSYVKPDGFSLLHSNLQSLLGITIKLWTPIQFLSVLILVIFEFLSASIASRFYIYIVALFH
mgnify:CR=1 FL=1